MVDQMLPNVKLAELVFLQIIDHIGKRQLSNRYIGTDLYWLSHVKILFTFNGHCSPFILHTFDINRYFKFHSQIIFNIACVCTVSDPFYAIRNLSRRTPHIKMFNTRMKKKTELTYRLLSDNVSHFRPRLCNGVLPLQSIKTFKFMQHAIYHPRLIAYLVSVSLLRKLVNSFSLQAYYSILHRIKVNKVVMTCE